MQLYSHSHLTYTSYLSITQRVNADHIDSIHNISNFETVAPPHRIRIGFAVVAAESDHRIK